MEIIETYVYLSKSKKSSVQTKSRVSTWQLKKMKKYIFHLISWSCSLLTIQVSFPEEYFTILYLLFKCLCKQNSIFLRQATHDKWQMIFLYYIYIIYILYYTHTSRELVFTLFVIKILCIPLFSIEWHGI